MRTGVRALDKSLQVIDQDPIQGIVDAATGIPHIRLMEFEWDENKAAANLDSMSDEKIETAALSDLENPPLTDEELAVWQSNRR